MTAALAPALPRARASAPRPGLQASCLYEGSVRHRRLGHPRDEFHYRMFMAYLDLDELPQLFDGSLLWSAKRPSPAWFRRTDHLGDPRTPLKQAVGELVLARTGIAVQGPIRLLTHLRYFGHCFNPVSFYYCFDADGEHLQAVVADVTNTPWGERHAYVMATAAPIGYGGAQVMRGSFQKRLHVSPLMGMQQTYEWRLGEPGRRLSVHIESRAQTGGERVFDATLSLARRELSPSALRGMLARYPLLTLRLTTRIYTHALRLRLRGARYHPHPDRHAGAAGP